MRYARNSSSFVPFAETREKFWKRLRVRGYPFRFLLHCYAQYATVIGQDGFVESPTVGLAVTRLLSLKPLSTVVTHASHVLLARYYQIWITHHLHLHVPALGKVPF